MDRILLNSKIVCGLNIQLKNLNRSICISLHKYAFKNLWNNLRKQEMIFQVFCLNFLVGCPWLHTTILQSMIQNTKSCNRIKNNKQHRCYKHQQENSSCCSEYFRSFIVANINMKGGKTLNFLNEPNSTYLLCQERHKNHIKSLNKRSEVKPTENNKRRKPPVSTSYDLNMTSRMRCLGWNGSIQSTFQNLPN